MGTFPEAGLAGLFLPIAGGGLREGRGKAIEWGGPEPEAGWGT